MHVSTGFYPRPEYEVKLCICIVMEVSSGCDVMVLRYLSK